MPMLLLSELDAARSCCQLAALQRLGLRDALLQDLRAAASGKSRSSLVSLKVFIDTKPRSDERLVQVILPARLGEVGLGLVEVAQVGVAGLRQRQLLAAHVVELLLDLGLLLERRQLQLGVGQDREQLALASPARRPRPASSRPGRPRPRRDRR